MRKVRYYFRAEAPHTWSELGILYCEESGKKYRNVTINGKKTEWYDYAADRRYLRKGVYRYATVKEINEIRRRNGLEDIAEEDISISNSNQRKLDFGPKWAKSRWKPFRLRERRKKRIEKEKT